MKDALAVIAALIAMFSTVPYLIDIVKGKTKPNIVSWFTWTLLTGIAAAAAYFDDSTKTALLLAGSSICTGAVVILGLKYGIAKMSKFDAFCQAGAVLGLILWLIFNTPEIAIIFTITIDFIVVLPTLHHAWLKPGEETWQTFAVGSFAALLTVLSLTSYTVTGLAFPQYLVLINAFLAGLIIWRRKVKHVTPKPA